MLERFKRADHDRNESGAVATSDSAEAREERMRAREARRAQARGETGETTRVSDSGTTSRTGTTSDESSARYLRSDDTSERTRSTSDDTTRVTHDDGTSRTRVADADRTEARRAGDAPTEEHTAGGGVLTRDALKTARARQRDEFGGLNWGASFFGWLVAVGVAAIITGLLAAAGAVVDITAVETGDVESIGLGGGIALLAALMLAYYCGGYVAGRMSRFDGARQGIGVWLIALAVTAALALLAAIAGDDYNVLTQLNLPSVPVGESELRSGGWIALVAIVVGTFLAAMVGGKAGERFHRRIDRAGFAD